MLKTHRDLALLSLVLLLGCVPPIRTRITAFAQAGAATPRRFTLEGPDPRFPGGDPRWPTFSRILTRALEAKGFIADPAAPELVIRVRYRVGDTQTFTATSTTLVTQIGPMGDPVTAPTTSTSVSESTLCTIQLEALDPSSIQAGQPQVLWSLHALSRGADDDLAKVFPAMAASMEAYFGKGAETMVTVVRRQSDPEARRLAGNE